MQALSSFSSKGASLASTHLDPDMVSSSSMLKRRKRKKMRDFGVPFCSCHCPQKSFLSSCSCSWGTPILSSRNGLLAIYEKLNFYEAKKSFFGRSFAISLASEQKSVGGEHEVGFSDEVVNFPIIDNNEKGLEKIVDSEENDAELVEKKKVDVRALARSLQDAKTADDVATMLEDLANELPLPVYSSMIRGFGVEKRLDAAFALVEWLKSKSKDTNGALGPNLFIYNSLLGAVKHTEQFGRVDEVMEEMKLQGIDPNIVTYNTLMSVYLEQGQPGEALGLLDEIERNGLSPSPITYSTILLAYRTTEDATGALEFFVDLRQKYENGEMKKVEDVDWESEFVKLEKYTIRICYLLMRQWLVKEENPTTDIFKLLDVMETAGVMLSRVECEKLLWACTNESHYTVAKELYRRTREVETGVSLSVCNHVIWLMGKAKKWWAALEIYEELLDKGPKPNNLSYELIFSHFNVLLNAARRRGIWKWAVMLINKMQDRGLKPGPREWNAVLVACSKASETSVVVEIFRRMVEQGEKPTVLSYGALLSALEKGKLYEEALKVWEHMCKVGIKPNLHAYTILASVYIGHGKPEMIDSIVREMVSSGIEPSVVSFNSIISGCAKNQMGTTAFEWFNRMKDWNIIPNEITYDMLIQALTKDAKPRLAYDMYLRACSEGLSLSSRSYDAIVESSRAYASSLDVYALGPRPPEKKRTVRIRKDFSDFCELADLPRRGKPFDSTEIFTSKEQES